METNVLLKDGEVVESCSVRRKVKLDEQFGSLFNSKEPELESLAEIITLFLPKEEKYSSKPENINPELEHKLHHIINVTSNVSEVMNDSIIFLGDLMWKRASSDNTDPPTDDEFFDMGRLIGNLGGLKSCRNTHDAMQYAINKRIEWEQENTQHLQAKGGAR